MILIGLDTAWPKSSAEFYRGELDRLGLILEVVISQGASAPSDLPSVVRRRLVHQISNGQAMSVNSCVLSIITSEPSCSA